MAGLGLQWQPVLEIGLELAGDLAMTGDGLEDFAYAERIARLRAYYFDSAPELSAYLASVQPSQRLALQGLHGGLLRSFRTIAGMIGVVTAVLTGAATSLIVALAAGHSAIAGFATGAAVGVATLAGLMWYQHRSWQRTIHLPLFVDEQENPDTA